MDSNKDEALRALSIAQKHRNASNYASARKFALKSISLWNTLEAKTLLSVIETEAAGATGAAGEGAEATGNGSGAETHPSKEGAHHRHGFQSTEGKGKAKEAVGGGEQKKREYTPEQMTVVKRVTKCKVTQYYEILELKKDCEEADVKKAYRKLALALHPDKNGAPGADEAFKMVSKAFQILSDSQKRSAFDVSGSDPEDRSGGMRSSASASRFGGGGGGMAFDGELNPEDLFNMFFGGGGAQAGFGNGFGGPGVFTTTFGPGGFRTVHVGGGGGRGRQRAQPGNNGNGEQRSTFMQLLPLLVLLGFTLLSSLPSFFETAVPPEPTFSFQSSNRFNVEQLTHNLGIKYHVNPTEMMRHPGIGPEFVKEGLDLGTPRKETEVVKRSKAMARRMPTLSKFEKGVETRWTNHLYSECQRELNQIERLKEREVGVFGLGTNWEKVNELTKQSERIHSCNELKRLGIIR